MTSLQMAQLKVLIDHARRDIGYGAGGSYIREGTDDLDQTDVESSLRAIQYLESLMMKKQHQNSARKINKAFRSGKIKIDL